MASELLKTFQKIESGRQLQIEKARALGHSLSDRASFAELAATIATPQEIPENTVGTVLEDWVPPVEFPDGKRLIRESEDRDGFKAGMYLLLKGDTDTITLYKKNSANITASASSRESRTGASGILTSDGTWYNDLSADIVHTWDTSKDIIIEDGEFAGNYRWLLCYYDPNSGVGNNFGIMNGYPIVDWIVGYIATTSPIISSTTPSYSGVNLLSSWYSNFTSLLNFEVLPESNVRTTYGIPAGTAGGLGYYLTNLRHIDFGPIVNINIGSGQSHHLFYNSRKLRHIDMSNITTFTNGTRNFIDILNIINCESLVSFKLGASATVGMRGYYANLKEFIAPKATIWTDDVTKDYQRTFIVPEDCDFEAYCFYGMLPINWRTNKGIPVEGGYQALGYTSSRLIVPFIKFQPFLEYLDLSKGSQGGTYYVTTDGTTYHILGQGCPRLKEIVFPQDWYARTSVAYLDLTHGSLIDLLDKVKDLTGLTVYNPNLRLGKQNLDKLTEAEIRIATDKGWSVIE